MMVQKKLVQYLLVFNLFLGLAFSKEVKVRVGFHPEKERIVLEFNETVGYEVFTLENPKRIVVDIKKAVFVNLPKNLKASSENHPWGTRFVFERDFDEIKYFHLQNPYRVVVDVYGRKENQKEKKDEKEEPPVQKASKKVALDEEFLRLLVTSLLGKGDLEEAYRISKIAVERYPKSPYWLDLHAKICIWTNRTQEAFEVYKRLVALDPSTQNVKNLFRMALASNKFDIAAQLIKEYEYLREETSIKDLVYIFQEAGEINKLISMLEDLYERKKDPNILQNLAQISYNYGDPKRAFEYMKRLESVHGFKTAEQVNLYSEILFVMRRYKDALDVLKKYVGIATDKDTTYFENLSDLAWFLRDFDTALYASKRLEDMGKGRLVDYMRIYMVLYAKENYKEASLYAKKGYEIYKDFYLLTGYVQSLRLLKEWNKIAKFLSDKEEQVMKSSYLSSVYFRALYMTGEREKARNFLKTALEQNPSEDLLSEAIYSTVDNSDKDLALYLENNYKHFRDKAPKAFAALYLFLQNSQSALELLKAAKRESIEDLLLYADVLSLYGRESEAEKIRLSVLKKLSENLDDTYSDPVKLSNYLRIGINYLPINQFMDALKIAQKTLAQEVYEDIFQSYLVSKDQQDRLYYTLNLQKKKAKPWLQLNLALFYDDRDWQDELLEKYSEILPIRDRVEALRRTGQLKRAGYYAFKGLEENREDYLLYKQFRDLVADYYSKFENTLSYTKFSDVDFLRNQLSLRHYLNKGLYLNYDSVSWFGLSNRNAFLKDVKNVYFNRLGISKISNRGRFELGVSNLH
ncbi:MAG: tetratricopeptide repeat protein, partial [Aquificaceae bacterium]